MPVLSEGDGRDSFFPTRRNNGQTSQEGSATERKGLSPSLRPTNKMQELKDTSMENRDGTESQFRMVGERDKASLRIYRNRMRTTAENGKTEQMMQRKILIRGVEIRINLKMTQKKLQMGSPGCKVNVLKSRIIYGGKFI
ncbi:hypothetical protein CEXT_676421 [Caerostris extrusa]|uniref:Uncharacterized protein n=1 Tax=Caerostris extrusa TaxID=172846 RepID=A0AAV4X3V2_CAEEX|nr:hypothetical protein CEXT_676421 [Caerostris extrusa]